MTEKTIGVVLVNWNCHAFTIRCIDSIMSATRKPDIIVVVDNGSSDDSVSEITRSFDFVHVIENDRNYGFTGANNIGIQYLQGNAIDYIWILNNDTIVSQNCLEALYASLGSDGNAVAATGKIYQHDTNVIWFAGSKFNRITYVVTHRGEGEEDAGQYDKEEYIDFFDGCCLLIKSLMLRDIGLFDENFFAYYEDVDLAMRIARNNGKIKYVPNASLQHFVGASFEKMGQIHGGTSSPLQYFLTARNKLYIVRRYGKWYNVLVCVTLLLVSALPVLAALLLLGRYKKVHAFLKGLAAGFSDRISFIETIPRTIPYT